MRMLSMFATLAILTSSLCAADWPQWRGPNRDDISPEKNLLKSWKETQPKLLWTFREAGMGYSGPAIVGDRLYSMGADKDKEYIFAVDLKTQKKLWSTPIGSLFVNGYGDGPRGTPTVNNGLVYGIGGQGNLICVKADTGEQVWLKRLKQDLDGVQMSGWGYTESPLVDGDQVVATPGGRNGTIAAFDKKTGEILWQSKEFTDKAAYSSLVVGELGGVRQYVQLTGDSVAGVAAKDGKLLWRFARKGKTAVIPTPILAGGEVFISSGYSVGCNLVKVAADAGSFTPSQVYANTDMTNQHGGILKVGDYVYGYSDSKGWVCMDFKTGKVMWNNKSLGKGCLTYADGRLYCMAERDGTVALVEANPKEWKETGRLSLPEKTKLNLKRSEVWTHPVVANGKLYLRYQDLIYCYDVSDGKSS